MPIYVYTGLTESGAKVREERAAATELELRTELAGRGILVQSVALTRRLWALPRSRRVAPEEFAPFIQEFSALLRAGLTVPEALDAASERPDNERLGRLLAQILRDVRGGQTLSEASAHHADAFDALYVAALRTGERSGNLAHALALYRQDLQHKIGLRKKLSQALIYPLFLLIALAVILVVMFVFVMPRFAAMYADFGTQLPLPTRMLLAIVENFVWLGPMLLGAAAAAGWAGRQWAATPRGRLGLDRAVARLPLIGRLRMMMTVSRLARAVSTLLAGGTPLVEALNAARSALPGAEYEQRLRLTIEAVSGGQSLSHAARHSRLMPETALRMMAVGEKTGRLDAMLAEVALYYEEQVDARLSRMTVLIEPLLMLLMGVVVGGIIVIMYLPIFQMAEIIR